MLSRINEDIACILERDPAARSWFEVVTCYPGLHALCMHRLAHWCWRHRLGWLGRVLSNLARLFTGIEIHPGAVIGRRVFIDHGMGVVIGETAEIGDDCTIYQGVTLGGSSLHRGVKRHPTLGARVVVGAGAKVLGGFSVGDGARIGSNAVVVKPVPAGAVAIGIPARIIESPHEEWNAADTPFSAYGLDPSADDPWSIALHKLINETADLHRVMDAVLAALKAHRIDVPQTDKRSDDFDSSSLNKLID